MNKELPRKKDNASSLRHEINNLLAIIMLSAQMLETQSTQAKQYVKETMATIKKIQALLKKF